MNSMTGFGRADSRSKNLAVAVEISSVNNRFLEFAFRLPRQLSFLEPRLKDLIAAVVDRGRLTVVVSYEDYGLGIDKAVLNAALARDIHSHLVELKKKFKLSGEIEIGHFLQFQDLFKVERSEDLEDKVWPVVKKAATAALKQVVAMRQTEGANLGKDISARVKGLQIVIDKIHKLAGNNFEMFRSKMAARIEELLDKKDYDRARFEEEIAYLAERADISEECVRFDSHLGQFLDEIKHDGMVGRRLNFILQELNREANTIGSKSANPEITHMVVELKEEIERIREQVQNIE